MANGSFSVKEIPISPLKHFSKPYLSTAMNYFQDFFFCLFSVTKAREDDQVQLKNHQDQISQLKNVVEDVSTRMETMSTWVSNNEQRQTIIYLFNVCSCNTFFPNLLKNILYRLSRFILCFLWQKSLLVYSSFLPVLI